MGLDQAGRLSEWLEQAWLQRYLDRELTEDEIIWFETYLLRHPSLASWLEADNLLRDAVAVSKDLPEASASGKHILGIWRPMLAAACTVMAVGLGWFAGQQRQLPEYAVPSRVLYDTFRGSETPTSLVQSPLPTGEQSPIYIADIAVPAGASISRIETIDSPDAKVLSTDPIVSDGFLTLVLPNHWRGKVVLQLTWRLANGQPETTMRVPL